MHTQAEGGNSATSNIDSPAVGSAEDVIVGMSLADFDRTQQSGSWLLILLCRRTSIPAVIAVLVYT